MQVYRVAEREADKVLAALTAHRHTALVERYSSEAVYVIVATDHAEIPGLIQSAGRTARRVPSLTELNLQDL